MRKALKVLLNLMVAILCVSAVAQGALLQEEQEVQKEVQKTAEEKIPAQNSQEEKQNQDSEQPKKVKAEPEKIAQEIKEVPSKPKETAVPVEEVKKEEPKPAVEMPTEKEEKPEEIEKVEPEPKEPISEEKKEEPTQEIKSEEKSAEPIEEEKPKEEKLEKPKKEEQPLQPKEVLLVIEEPGIDTVELEEAQGNWLFKRIWWERAEERYEKIRKLVDKIWESRMNFFIKRNELDKKVLDPFYIAVGLGQGELQVILNDLLHRIEQERKEDIVLSDQERTLLDKLQVEKKKLDELKKDVESISMLDDDVDGSLNKLMEQINRVREYERDAWKNFSEIARVLSDKKAREMFYKMDIAWRNIKAINAYLEKEFTEHFSQILDRTKEHVDRVIKEIQALKEKGIDFKKQAEHMKIEEEQQERREEEPQMEEEDEKEIEVQPKGWLSSMVDVVWRGVKTIWDIIVYIVTLPYRLIVGG